MPRHKNSRQCTTPGCKLTPTLHPQCDKCRKAGCQHTTTHYDSNYTKVCDQCGITVQAGTKRKGRNMLGKGKKAPWQAHGQLTSRTQEEVQDATQ